MTKNQKMSFVRSISYSVIALVIAVLFIPMITVSETAVTNQTLVFKVVDWFTVLQNSIASQALLYILAIAFIVGLFKIVKHYKLY